ncbi:MAG: acyltransferase [Verrucomicrobiales bacterium]|nr:acyltransferase [Verrucomicrobiales bacterium]
MLTVMTPGTPGWRRRALESAGLYGLACRWRTAWHQLPLRSVNFLFQRVIGLNRGCPWPVNFTSVVTSAENIRIHPTVRASFAISGGCYIQGLNGIEIGAHTLFAPGVKIISANHDLGNYDTWVASGPIRIGGGCWIGANAVILPGVELGDGVVVGAGAVVTRSFEPGAIIGGSRPGRLGSPLGSPGQPRDAADK